MLRVHIGNRRTKQTGEGEAGRMRIVEGAVSGLQRVADVNGGVNMGASTYHICIFDLAGQRAQMGGWSPPPIAEGDILRAAGCQAKGVFDITACRNLTTGWTTPKPVRGRIDSLGFLVICAAVVAAAVASAFIGWYASLFPIGAACLAVYMARQSSVSESLWDYLMQDRQPRV